MISRQAEVKNGFRTVSWNWHLSPTGLVVSTRPRSRSWYHIHLMCCTLSLCWLHCSATLMTRARARYRLQATGSASGTLPLHLLLFSCTMNLFKHPIFHCLTLVPEVSLSKNYSVDSTPHGLENYYKYYRDMNVGTYKVLRLRHDLILQNLTSSYMLLITIGQNQYW